MRTSLQKRQIQSKQGMATWSKALLITGYCLFLMFAIVLVGTAKPPAPKVSRWHKRNPFFDPNAIPKGVTVDQVVSLKDVPVPEPVAAVIIGTIPGPGTNLNFQPLTTNIVKSQAALVRLGKALFWDMQAGSDGVQSCASCHFNAGADTRATNQISPNLSDTNFHANNAPNGSGLGGDNTFGDATMPYTANDPNTPTPPGPVEPPPANLNVPGHPQFAPNYTVTAGDFPVNDWFNPTELTPRGPGVTPLEEADNVAADSNDVIASQGVRFGKCNSPCTTPGQLVDNGTAAADIWNTLTPGFLNSVGVVRRAMPRNAPTMVNAVFNFDNLWEGRGSFVFNGVNGFGFRDRTSTLKYNLNGVPTSVFVRVLNSSLASVAVGPPTSNIAMSLQGRTFPDIGTKMLSMRPLALQFVHPQDSALGHFSRAILNPDGTLGGSRGLTIATYAQMIQAAFQNNWWNSPNLFAPVTRNGTRLIPEVDRESNGHAGGQTLPQFRSVGLMSNAPALGAPQYSQMEINFSLFFGLAVQAYEATLVSDNTPFDKFMGSLHPVRVNHGNPIPPQPNALTARQRLGLSVFLDDNATLGTHCADCHIPPVTTGHTVIDYQPDSQGVPSLTTGEAIEFMLMGDNGQEANYDHGMYNIGVRRSCITGIDPTTCASHNEDRGRGATAPKTPAFLNPLTGTLVAIGSISRSNNVVTVTTTTPNPLALGNFVAIEGVSDTSFNGIFAVATVLSTTQFTYAQTAANASSSGGTATGPNQPFPLSLVELVALLDDTSCNAAVIPHVGCLPPDVARFVPNIPILPRRVTNGAFKAPNLRNIKFSGPYFHAGDSATLRQVVEFYTRGGNFPNSNLHDKTVDVDGIPPLMFPQFNPTALAYIQALVDFLAEGLKDDRVAFEKAPFDHPELIIPNGSPASNSSQDILIDLPAVGRYGRGTELPTFLNLDPQQP
jgi:cytochrome c peroxidase